KNFVVLSTALAGGLTFFAVLLWGLGLGAVSAATLAGPNTPFDDPRHGADAAVRWLITTHQNDDGGYSSFSGGANAAASDVNGTLDALNAIASTGHNPAAVYLGKSSAPVHYLQNNPEAVAAYAAGSGGRAGKLLIGLAAANQDPHRFHETDYVLSLTEQLSPTGQYNVGDAFNQSLAILGLTAVSEPVPAAATDWLVSQQATNGSWDDGFGTLDNPDATAMAVMALIASGKSMTDTAVLNARDFLMSSQLATGGWEYGAGFGESTNTTALVVQALSALGEDFYSDSSDWAQGGTSPIQALYEWQNGTGAYQVDFGSGPFDDFFATVQALPASTGKPLPIASRAEAVHHALGCLDAIQDETTGGWAQFADFPGFPAEVNAGGTARAIQAIAAGGDDPQSDRWTTVGGTNAVAALETMSPDYIVAGRGGRTGIVMQGVAAAGAPYTVADFAGMDLELTMSGFLSPTGEYDSTAFGPMGHAEAMLGLIDNGLMVDETAVSFLYGSHTNGDWGSADSNGIVLSVLGQMDLSAPAGTVDTLRATQQADAGWGFGIPASPSSSSEVVQGLVAHGINPFAPKWSVVISGQITSVADTIMAQQADNGCWPNPFGPGDDPFGTTDAIMMLTQDVAWEVYQTVLPIIRK
ncbi:MAG: prenyltransferase/squalene oxidase repeat-containing protein, partial [Chloroflexota bacterium]